MKRIIHILILVASVLGLLSSCSQECYVNKYCPKVKDSVSVIREVKDSLVYRDSIIKEPGEVITVHDSVPCPDMVIEKKGKKGRVRVQIKDSIMTAECIIDTTEIALTWIEHHKKELVKYYRDVTHVVTVKAPKNLFQKVKDWVFWIVVAYFVFRLIRWILKMAGKWPFPLPIKRSG